MTTEHTLVRWYWEDYTLGVLTTPQFRCFSLELPDKGNAQEISCIPEGRYTLEHGFSPGLRQEVLVLWGVPGRTYIYIHNGNFLRQILGCILVGDSIKFLDEDDLPDVTNSANIMARLLKVVQDGDTLNIVRGNYQWPQHRLQ